MLEQLYSLEEQLRGTDGSLGGSRTKEELDGLLAHFLSAEGGGTAADE